MNASQQTQTTKEQPVIFLQGKRTILRPLSVKDAPTFQKWINDPEIRQFIRAYLPMTEIGETKWIESLESKREENIVLGIEFEGRLVGSMGVHGISWRDRHCTTGAVIGDKTCWGKGIGTDAKMALLNYIFNTLNLRKVLSVVYAFNKRSLHYSLHCGYKVEGVQRKQCFVNGRYVDAIQLGLFKHEWKPYWKAYKKGS